MNTARMRNRAMQVVRCEAGVLEGFRLVFNKRSADNPHISFANIAWQPGHQVEGVLYQLSGVKELDKMDRFEGSPRLYSREIFPVACRDGRVLPAWVYVANAAMISDGLRPERWYLEHLLAGRDYLSVAYVAALERIDCCAMGEAQF